MMVAEAGKFAPSGKNRQIANIYLVNSKRYVEKLRKLSIETLSRDCMYGAKTVLLVAGPQDDPFTFQDCSCVLENMFIAAHALNISSCWINQFNDLFQTLRENTTGSRTRKKRIIRITVKAPYLCIIIFVDFFTVSSPVSLI